MSTETTELVRLHELDALLELLSKFDMRHPSDEAKQLLSEIDRRLDEATRNQIL